MSELLTLNINTRQLKQLEKSINKYQKSLKMEIKQALTNTVLDIESEAKKQCPADTGRLRASISSQVESPIEGQVGTNVEYASAVEYGTKPHTIRPKKAKLLVWKDKDSKKIHTAKEVKHPGTKPQPFLEPAYLFGKDKAKTHFEDAFKRLEQLLKRI